MFQQIDNSNNYLFSLDRLTKIAEEYCLTKKVYKYTETDLKIIFKKRFMAHFSQANFQLYNLG